MSSGGLLAVHAHPDDETLSTGALLATYAAAGRPVTLVTCTRGERGEVIPAELGHLEGDGPALAAHREVELADAVRALGVGEHVLLDRLSARVPGPEVRWEDSGMAWLAPGRAGGAADLPPNAFVAADLDDAAARLADLVARRRPDVLVGYEPGGGYGHPDHVQAHRLLMRAVARLGDGAPPVLWAALDAAAVRRARTGLPPAAQGLSNPSPDETLPSAAVEDGIDLRVDVPPVAHRVRAALEAHRTQVMLLDDAWGDGPVLGTYALSNAVVQPVLTQECYRFAPGHGPGPAGLDLPAGVRTVA